MKLKERIPDEAALTERIEQEIVSITNEVRTEVGVLEADYRKYKRHQKIGIVLVIAAFFLPGLLIEVLGFLGDGLLALSFFIICFVLCLGFGLRLGIMGNEITRKFHSGVNRVLYKKIFKLLELTGRLSEQKEIDFDYRVFASWGVRSDDEAKKLLENHPFLKSLQTNPFDIQSGYGTRTLHVLQQSELITERFNRTRIDNAFDIEVGNSNLFISELNVKLETGSGKNRSIKQIFTGYFVSFDLDRTLEGKTFVSAEGDETGFGHRSFFTDIGKKGVQETKLEWNQFESKLHVATDNETEARYVFTTDFMSDLYLWWEGRKSHIRISFIGNHMYMLFPDGRVRFDSTIPRINEKEVKEYLLTIAKPLLHVVHLAENVQL